jgi:hypothetical protein
MRKIVLISFCLILIIGVASADVIFPLTFVTLPFFPFILVIEILVFVVYVRFVLAGKGIEISLKSVFLAVFTANLVSSAVGLIFPSHDSFAVTVLFAFLLSIVVEFFVYIAFFRIRKLELLKLSFLTNFTSYTALILHAPFFIKKINLWWKICRVFEEVFTHYSLR